MKHVTQENVTDNRDEDKAKEKKAVSVRLSLVMGTCMQLFFKDCYWKNMPSKSTRIRYVHCVRRNVTFACVS